MCRIGRYRGRQAERAFLRQRLQIAFGKENVLVAAGLEQAQRLLVRPAHQGVAVLQRGVVVAAARIAVQGKARAAPSTAMRDSWFRASAIWLELALSRCNTVSVVG